MTSWSSFLQVLFSPAQLLRNSYNVNNGPLIIIMNNPVGFMKFYYFTKKCEPGL